MITRQRVVVICGLVASTLALVIPTIFGALWPGYSHQRHYISMLGERDAPHAALVNYLGFLPIGIATVAFVVAIAPFLPAMRRPNVGRICLGAVGLAYVASAFFPCDAGCPALGSITQCIHSLFGIGEYLGATVGFALLSSSFRRDAIWRSTARWTLLCTVTTAVGFALMVTPTLAAWRGLSQRLAETAIFGWIATAAIRAGRRR